MHVFVIRGFGVKEDSAKNKIDFELVHRELIEPAIRQCAFSGGTTATHAEAGSIHADMFTEILRADLVICDITVHNANVFYELGVRHALRKKHTVLIKGDPSADKTPFDIAGGRYMAYPVADPGGALPQLVDAINAGIKVERETDSPIFLMLPKLREAQASDVCELPLSLIADIERAEAARDKGWLRLIAEDVAGMPIQKDALRIIGRAQWRLKDYAGARESWEAVRSQVANDLPSNLALANIYQRLYVETLRPVLLEKSNQAIRAVLDVERLGADQRAEALALQGRNLKTLWRLDFDAADSIEARREAALNQKLMDSFDAYKMAYATDLNAYYPGIAALQMGFILQSLSTSPHWRNLFDGHRKEAEHRRVKLDEELLALRHVVEASVKGALSRDPKDKWAKITRADLLFLTVPDDALADDAGVIASAYQSVIDGDGFDWDATRGQLMLFASLGIRAELAAEVIRTVSRAIERAAERSGHAKTDTKEKPVHLVVFTGHIVDGPGTAVPRFPPAAEADARALVEARLHALLNDEERLLVLASAAPGADILVHEICATLGLQSTLCLPMPENVVAREAFKDHDSWLARFRAVVRSHEASMRVLADDPDPPTWFGLRASDPWERGNRWVVKTAQSWGAKRVTMLALWDREECPGSTGGTAHLMRLAKQTGEFEFEVIESKRLVGG